MVFLDGSLSFCIDEHKVHGFGFDAKVVSARYIGFDKLLREYLSVDGDDDVLRLGPGWQCKQGDA